ncbi:MAG: NifB/NifX family molybdenum-iron cluster-binding protein [Candidatus Aenigmarchaeota archaeon]|nr:NifB/NifX family molybdenum-iron cluster-binding protein [Candidatus Aenigmarchaeota archaeon]
MKLAISTDNGQVSEHFGRCPQFTIVDIENGKVAKKETIENPGHVTGFLPKFFHDIGADIVIAGGAGGRAQEFFSEFGIKLILGVTGSVDEVIEKYAAGKLETGESTCVPRAGKGYGIKKEDGHED